MGSAGAEAEALEGEVRDMGVLSRFSGQLCQSPCMAISHYKKAGL